MYCTNCGREVGENHKFCSNCGKELRHADPDEIRLEPAAEIAVIPEKPVDTLGKVMIGLSLAALICSMFPFHDGVLVAGTAFGVGTLILAILQKTKGNPRFVTSAIIVALTAIAVSACWFVFFYIAFI